MGVPSRLKIGLDSTTGDSVPGILLGLPCHRFIGLGGLPIGCRRFNSVPSLDSVIDADPPLDSGAEFIRVTIKASSDNNRQFGQNVIDLFRNERATDVVAGDIG